MSLQIKIFIGLIITLAALAAISIFLPTYQALMPTQELPASKPILALINVAIIIALYGGLGFIGLKLSKKLGWPEIWDKNISNKQRFFIPGLIGVGCGIIFIIGDIIFSKFNGVGHFPHPEFPMSVLASLSAGIGEEIIFRLFFISFWTWLISRIIFKNRGQNQIFWIVSVVSAIAFALGHLPSVMILYGLTSVNAIPPLVLMEIILLNGIVSIFAAFYFKKFGFLAPVGIHFWTDIVWHVLWGLI